MNLRLLALIIISVMTQISFAQQLRYPAGRVPAQSVQPRPLSPHSVPERPVRLAQRSGGSSAGTPATPANAGAERQRALKSASRSKPPRYRPAPPIRDPARITTQRIRSWKQMRERNIVMQQHDYSCGAAALATLVKYYWGDPLTEAAVLVAILSTLETDEIKERMENGLSIADLEEAATALGYFAQVGSGTMKQLSEAKAPAIVRIIDGEFEHFVVYRGIWGDRVLLADPIRGNIRMPIDEFMCQWLERGTREGVVLIVAKKDVEDLPENAPLSVKPHPHKFVVPERQAMRRGLFRFSVPSHFQ